MFANAKSKMQNPKSAPVWLQFGFLGLLFLGSLLTLAYGALAARPGREMETATRQRLGRASSRMATAAATLIESSNAGHADDAESQSRRLSRLAEEVLRDYEGVEGGFYLDGRRDRFSGYAFPTGRPRPPRRQKRDDPPPMEEPYIRILARESLSLPPGEVSTSVRDVGPSRVMMLTEPVGAERPAVAATWLMYRLVDPALLDRKVQQYRVSSGLALGGLFLAMLLMLGLARNLKRQQQEQARLQNELRRSERLASLGKLLAGVAHEVRNPLAAIRSTVQLWQRMPERSRTPESLEATIAAVDRLNETVSQLLYFSRADGTQRESVDVNRLLRDTVELFAAQAGSQHVAIVSNLSEDVGSIEASPGALQQVFSNLTTNALQAMPDGGQLTVSTRRAEAGDRIAIEFADTGPGIPAEIKSHLFEPFFTTRPQGTGLGLALCREIILQHDGTIECIDAPGGAQFRIEVPR